MTVDLSDYVEVPERLATFRAKYPEGCLQSRIIELPEAYRDKFIAVEARAYRGQDDRYPGYGLAWEPVPGKTPYTKDSELMNAETSAWGRAIVAVLAADTKRGIASAQEVKARQGSGGAVTVQGKGRAASSEQTSGGDEEAGSAPAAKASPSDDSSARTAESTPATAPRTAVPPRAEDSRGAGDHRPPSPPPDYPNFRLPKTTETAELGGYFVDELADKLPDKLEAFLGKGWFTTRQEAIIRFHLDRVKEAAK